MSAKKPSEAQAMRQLARSSRSGKYTKHNPCEMCGKSVGHDYFSLSWVDEAPFEGRGLVLHEACAEKLENLGKAKAYELLLRTLPLHSR